MKIVAGEGKKELNFGRSGGGLSNEGLSGGGLSGGRSSGNGVKGSGFRVQFSRDEHRNKTTTK